VSGSRVLSIAASEVVPQFPRRRGRIYEWGANGRKECDPDAGSAVRGPRFTPPGKRLKALRSRVGWCSGNGKMHFCGFGERGE